LNTLSEILIKSREREGLTQDVVAQLIKKSLRTYQYYEEGKIMPKHSTLVHLSQILKFDPSTIFNETELHEEDISSVAEDEEPYLTKRFSKKINSGPYMVPLVPVKAQAGYRRRYNNTDFLNELKSYPIVPGVDPHGAIWRYFQVDGDSMMNFLNNGDYVLSNQIAKEDWPEIKDYHVYVVVTDDLVTIKRIFKRKHFKELVLIPENEKFDQKVINTEDIKEIWRYRRHIGWNASSPKKFEIKV
jgi:phage repressor protein C with HTH and peptisase S24 domain